MKRMLFNATQSEELRVAIVDGQKLIDLDIESAGKEQRKSNIYKGIITRIEPSLEAAFVNYGTDRHGFLPFKEVARSYFLNDAEGGRARIQDVLKEGQELIVQVDKDERGNKGAALTTFISLAGRYLVLMPNNPRGGGVSRRIEGEDRNELRDVMAQLEVPAGMSIIARTAGIGRTLEELQWDLSYLLQLWTAVESASTLQSGPFLIYQEGSLVIRAIRDYFQPDIGEILIDTADIHEQAVQFMNHVMPGNVSRVKLYRDEIPLFSRFQIEHQIETAFSREVRLPSGGAIVIDHTEALVSIDVNSGRSTKGSDIEHTAFNTNLEAADEVARQLRLRDLGGLVVIDFIDMESQRNQREVENRLRDALHYDRARVQTGKISRFGLLELSRQRLRPSLGETNHMPCPRCHGTGHIRGIESTALHILRITQEEAMKENSAIIQVQLPVEAATFLLNEKRAEIHKIELRMGVQVVLIPNIHMETPNYNIVRIRHDDVTEESTRASYQMVEVPNENEGVVAAANEPKPVKAEAAVKGITPATSAPISVEKETPKESVSVFSKIGAWFGGLFSSKEEEAKPEQSSRRDQQRGNRNGKNRNNRNNRGERAERPDRNGQERTQAERPQNDRNPNERNKQERNGNERNEADKQQRPQQENRNNKQQRQPQPKPVVAEVEKAVVATNTVPAVGDANTDGGQPQREPRSRRGRNGRRDRGPRGENRVENGNAAGDVTTETAKQVNADMFAEAPASQAMADVTTVSAVNVPTETVTPAAQAPVVAATAVEATVAVSQATTTETAPAAKPVEATPDVVASVAVSQPESTIEVVTTKAVVSEEASETSAAEEPATVEKAEKKARAPRKSAAKAKPTEIAVDLAASGLQLVETKADAVAAPVVVEEVVATKPKKTPAWKQKAAEATAEEPLVIVQTQKE